MNRSLFPAAAAARSAAPVDQSPPTITGNALVGKTLTAASGSWSGVGNTYAFQDAGGHRRHPARPGRDERLSR
jgi:hypothetical protein